MEQMQDPSVRGGPDQQDGPGEEGVSGEAIPAPFPRPPVPRGISSVQVIAVCVCVGGALDSFLSISVVSASCPPEGGGRTPQSWPYQGGVLCVKTTNLLKEI